MRPRVHKSEVGRFYWRTVKRWPAVYVVCCLWGLAIGIGCLWLFGEPELDARTVLFLRLLGVLMLVVYSWWLISFVVRFARGAWASHCDNRIVLFGGEFVR
jgi:hypothetical protein